MRSLILSVLAAVISLCGVVSAEPLALIHDATATCKAGGLRQACTTGRIDVPRSGDLVALCPNVANCWDGAPLMQVFEKVPAAAWIDGCANPTALRGAKLPVVWSSEADPCKDWEAFPASTFAPASTFTAAPASGASPLSVVLTWNVTGVDGCTASDGWNGAKAIKGTQAVTGITAAARYTLKCDASAALPGSALVRWTPPTANMDGSALADLVGYRIQYDDDDWTTLPKVQDVKIAAAQPVSGSATDRQYTVAGLTAGKTWTFTMTAYTASAESEKTEPASKVIPAGTGAAFAQSVNVAITGPTQPNPPTLLMVTATTAYQLLQSANKLYAVAIGTVTLKTPCDGTQAALGFHRVDVADVKLMPGRARPNVALAKCG